MSLEGDLSRGAKAEQLLNNPIFQEAFESVSKSIHELWETSPLRDREGAHELRLMLKLLGDLKSVFELAVTDGKVAQEELKRLNSNVLTPAQWSAK